MAALEKIRNRAGLLIAVVGIALLSFILGDLFSGTNSYRDQPEIAKINGEKIHYFDYQQRVDDAVENMKRQTGQPSLDEKTYSQIQDQVWDQLVNKVIMDGELKALGISVTPEELLDMVQGNNVHPEVRNIPLFQNPETGSFDPQRVIQFLQNLDADNTGRSRQAWMSFEDYLLQQRQNDKYFSAISKGIYITDLYAKKAAIEKATKVDMKALFLPYADINDTTINVTTKELNDYYQKNKNQHKQELSIDIEYVVFPISATQSDIEVIVSELEDMRVEFATVNDNQSYVNANSDGAFDGKYYRRKEYPNSYIDSVMFSLKEGELYGPYKEGDMYKLTKLVKKENQPDSVQISQIIIAPKTQEEVEIKKSQADSLLNLVKKGTKIADLARFSEEPSMVKPTWVQVANLPYAESLVKTKKGDAIMEATGEGFMVIQVVDRGKEEMKIQMASLERHVSPSEQTRTNVYQKANAFASSIQSAYDFNKAVEDKGLVKRAANSLTQTSRDIRGLDNARPLIREAFFATEGNLIAFRSNNSPIFEIGESYVVGYLKKRRDEGFVPMEEVKPTLEAAVRKQKKAEILVAKAKQAMAETSDLEQLAGKLNATVKDINGLTFAAFSVPGVGIEPKINGMALKLAKGDLSQPIDGNNGVYILSIIEKHEVAPEEVAFEMEKLNLRRNLQGRVSSEIAKMLKESVKIDDNRLMYQ